MRQQNVHQQKGQQQSAARFHRLESALAKAARKAVASSTRASGRASCHAQTSCPPSILSIAFGVFSSQSELDSCYDHIRTICSAGVFRVKYSLVSSLPNILLRGSYIEELKEIKHVVSSAVLMAYHFIAETSFLTDQEAMLSTFVSDGVVSIETTPAVPKTGADSEDFNGTKDHINAWMDPKSIRVVM